jgi:hypothetical protein
MIIDDGVVSTLRAESVRLSPSEVARMLDHLVPEGLRQDTLVFYFKRAFPDIPLKALLDAQAWSTVGPGPLSDQQLDELLFPWWTRAPGDV